MPGISCCAWGSGSGGGTGCGMAFMSGPRGDRWFETDRVLAALAVRKGQVPYRLRLAAGAKALDGRYAGPERVSRKWKRRGPSAEFSCRFSTHRANGDTVEHYRRHVKVEVAVKDTSDGGGRRQSNEMSV